MSGVQTAAAVLDTNVLLDWFVFRNPRVSPLAAAVCGGRLRWLATAAMRAELERMLAHHSLARWSPDAAAALALLDRHAVPCSTPQRCALVCSDADDQVFIDLAVSSRARWLLTQDRALLKLAGRARVHGVGVLSPIAWNRHHGMGG